MFKAGFKSGYSRPRPSCRYIDAVETLHEHYALRVSHSLKKENLNLRK